MFYAIEITYGDDFLGKQHAHPNTNRGRRSRPCNNLSRQRQAGNGQRDMRFDAIKHIIFIDGRRVVEKTIPRDSLHGGYTALYPRGTVRNRTGHFRFAQLAIGELIRFPFLFLLSRLAPLINHGCKG